MRKINLKLITKKILSISKSYLKEFPLSSQFKYMIYGFVGVVVIFLGIIFIPGVKERMFPNSWISEKYTQEGLYANINPGFKVEFGDKEDTDIQIVRFETKVHNGNPFSDADYEEIGFWQKVKEFFLGKPKSALTMRLEEVSSSNVLGVDSKYAETTTDIETTTKVRDLSRTFSDYFDEIKDDGSVNKDTVINEDVADGVDVEYQIIDGIGLKEEIIVNWKDGFRKDCTTDCAVPANSFIFDLLLDDGVELHKSMATTQDNPKGTYYFTDEKGRYIAHFLPSFAVDAMGSVTNDVDFEVKDTGEELKYRINVIVDSGWMMSENRAYPIRIDPSIVHDTEAEFDAGDALNRVESVSGPRVQLVEQELAADAHTVALWHLNETSGTTVSDSSGNGNTLTATNTEDADWTAGKLANGINLDGSNEYLTRTYDNSFNFGTGDFTIEGWFKHPSISAVDYLLARYDADQGFKIWMDASGDMCVGLDGDATWTPGDSVCTAAAEYDDNNWHHFAVVKKNIAGLILYVDGHQVAEKIVLVEVGTLTSNSAVLNIGSDAPTAGSYWEGMLDEIRISDVARSHEEIKISAGKRDYGLFISDIINLTANVLSIDDLQWDEFGVKTGAGETPYDDTSLVAQWNFNETSGTAANNDAEGTSCGGTPANCDGTLVDFASTASQDQAVGTGWTLNNSRYGSGAIMIDGAGDRIDIATDDPFQIQTFSIETWVKPENYTAYRGMIFTCRNSSDYKGYIFEINTSGLFRFTTVNDTGGAVDEVIGTTSVKLGNWYHVVVTVEQGVAIKLYVNGRLVASDTSIADILYDAVHYPSIGNTPGRTTYFDGVIDTTRFYSRVMTESEIISNYNSSNIEFQTRTSSNGTDWDDWETSSNETVLATNDSASSLWPWEIMPTLYTFPREKSNSMVIKAEGSGSVRAKVGYSQIDNSTGGLWHLDETNGDNAGDDIFDATTNNNDGEIVGTTLAGAVVDGIFGKARSFSGTDAGVIVIDDSATLEPSGESFTIEAWVKKTGTTSGDAVIVGKWDAVADNRSVALVYLSSTASLEFWVDSNGTSGTECSMDGETAGSLDDGNWHYVVGVYDDALDMIYTYIDGRADDANGATCTAIPESNSAPWSIGNSTNAGAAGTDEFEGYIDEVRISLVAYDAQEVAEAYRMAGYYRLSRTISSVDLSSSTKMPFWVASDRQGSFLSMIMGESKYVNYLPDEYTVGFWHLEEDAGSYIYPSISSTEATNYEPVEVTSIDDGDGADGDITVSANQNINTDTMISGRSCADGGDAVNYSVTALTSTSATLSSAASAGCLNDGDEVLLINLAGTSDSVVNVGNYEVLTVNGDVNGSSTVNFTSSKTKYYGNGASDDTDLGVTTSEQRVMLQRVPNYNDVTINEGYTLTASAWNDVKNGVLFFKANGNVMVNGTISSSELGYTGGAASQLYYSEAKAGQGIFFTNAEDGEGGSGDDNNGNDGTFSGGGGAGMVVGDGTTHLGGSGSTSVGALGGGGGGSSYRRSSTSSSYGGGGGGGGHFTGGQGGQTKGTNYAEFGDDTSSGDGDANVTGAPQYNGGGGGGKTIGEEELLVMFMGGGGGGGGFGMHYDGDPYNCSGGIGGRGGGVLYLSVNNITGTGSIYAMGEVGNSAECTYGGGGGGGGGGSLKLQFTTGVLTGMNIDASGGYGDTTPTNDGGKGGDGIIRVEYVTSINDVTKSDPTEGYDYGTGADGSIAITANTDFNTMIKGAGRTCADAKNFVVTALTSTSATISTSGAGCLYDGDEVLLINMQGTQSSIVNLGKYETLIVDGDVSGTTVNFTTSKVNYYGSGASDDNDIGTSVGYQRVMLQRIPHYKNVTVNSGVSLYPSDWSNSTGLGGVLFFRASGVVKINGTITATGAGYAGGTYVGTTFGGGEGEGASISTSTTAGHGGNSTNPPSVGYAGLWSGGGGGGCYTTNYRAGGSGTTTAGSSGGGGGGSTTRRDATYNGYAGGGGGGGHATGGEGGYSPNTGGAGVDGSASGAGAGGTSGIYSSHVRGGSGGGGMSGYGDADLDLLTMGGGGGGGARGQGSSGSYYAGTAGGAGGGIVYISGYDVRVLGALTANGDGSSAAGTCGGTGGGGAGGSLKLITEYFTEGTVSISANGGIASTAGGGDGGNGGDGYIQVYYNSDEISYEEYSLIGDVTNTDSTVGKIGRAKNFDGTNDYIYVENIDVPTTDFTYDAWVYVDNYSSSRYIFEVPDSASANEFYLHVYTDGSVRVLTNGSVRITSYAITTHQWYHLAVTRSVSDIRLYINGDLAGVGADGTALAPLGCGLLIGADSASGCATTITAAKFDGIIDEPRVSNIARTAAEIRQAYEYGLRSHTITFDFKASLDSGNLITGSGDTSFTIDSTTYGAEDMGENLYLSDKVIVKETVNDTEYLAQGEVTSVNESTGAVTVSSWETGSTFPTSGFTTDAVVFKWQREFFDFTAYRTDQIDATTELTFFLLNGDQGADIWFDSFAHNTSYLTDPLGTANVVSSPKRYLQYRGIFTTRDALITPYISEVTMNYELGPSLEQLMRHGMYFDNQVKQDFWWGP